MINTLIITGFVTKEHNFRDNNNAVRELLEATGQFKVDTTEAYFGITPEMVSRYDLLLINYDGKNFPNEPEEPLGETTENTIFEFVAKGGGVGVLHSSLWVDDNITDEYKKLLGGWLSGRYGSRRNPNPDSPVRTVRDDSGITDCMRDEFLIVNEDFFAGIQWHKDARVSVLATFFDNIDEYRVPSFLASHANVNMPDGTLESMPEVNTPIPVAWTNLYGSGRVLCTTIGHSRTTFMRQDFMSLFIRGLEWAATGRATIPPPDRSGDLRLRPWPYY